MNKLFDRKQFEYIRNMALWFIQYVELYPVKELRKSAYCARRAAAVIIHDRYLIQSDN